MTLNEKRKVNRKIGDILNLVVGELNNEQTRDKIGLQIKVFLEQENIKFETLNYYTSNVRVDLGLIDIEIDKEKYPFSIIDEINEENLAELMDAYEKFELDSEDTIKFFQYLINEGFAWNTTVAYRKSAINLIECGYCTLGEESMNGNLFFGYTKIPSKYEVEPFNPGSDEYVEKRKKMKDKEFYSWVNSKIYN